MNKRVYGIIGIRGLMANWNADFTGRPKTTVNDVIYGSDKALKYTMKHQLKREGQKVFFIKEYKLEEKGEKKGTLKLFDREEKYQALFGSSVVAKTETFDKVINNMFSCQDVRLFGAVFASSKHSFGARGAVQISQGLNVFEDTNIEIQDILSPFPSKNSGGEDSSGNGSIGKLVLADETHYMYGFSIDPKAYDEFGEMLQNPFTEEDYEIFKRLAKTSVNSYNSVPKAGMNNTFAMFVEFEDGLKYLPNLANFVDFKTNDKERIINLDKLVEMLKDASKVEIYIDKNVLTLDSKNLPDNWIIKSIYED